MHALEKILAYHAGLKEVRAGEIVNCKVDLAGINDLYPQTMYSFREIGGEKVACPDKVVIFLDHYAPPSTIKAAQTHAEFRQFAREQGIEKLMDVNEGVCHQVLADKGLTRPGMLIVITDSHTTTHGAFGAFGTGVGATDLACILKTGELWFRVPRVVKINLNGTLQPGVYAKDVILHVIGKVKADFAIYKGVEFAGTLIPKLSVSERMALCNMTTEIGAKTAYIQPDEVTISFLKEKGVTEYNIFTTDPDYQYEEELTFDVSEIGPQVAAPFSVDNVYDLQDHIGTPIDQAFLGTCTGGRLEDIAIAAKILKGRKIHKNTRMLVVPASMETQMEAIRLGYMQDLLEAGCTFVTPGCAACLGTHEGLIAEGETCITSSSRNFPGRMGHKKGKIFLASPATVAASALNGVITDPTPYLK
ncbi:MAG TPA: 3-isopropylmalate dehydratase large subunit [Acholeplasmataceae bacterium]|jgi:3-isopropylmalate dehydratase large subunit|nr:3-isopropylmalate dehydratase large subunit [Acholeplasmataceae bacterium]